MWSLTLTLVKPCEMGKGSWNQPRDMVPILIDSILCWRKLPSKSRVPPENVSYLSTPKTFQHLIYMVYHSCCFHYYFIDVRWYWSRMTAQCTMKLTHIQKSLSQILIDSILCWCKLPSKSCVPPRKCLISQYPQNIPTLNLHGVLFMLFSWLLYWR